MPYLTFSICSHSGYVKKSTLIPQVCCAQVLNHNSLVMVLRMLTQLLRYDLMIINCKPKMKLSISQISLWRSMHCLTIIIGNLVSAHQAPLGYRSFIFARLQFKPSLPPSYPAALQYFDTHGGSSLRGFWISRAHTVYFGARWSSSLHSPSAIDSFSCLALLHLLTFQACSLFPYRFTPLIRFAIIIRYSALCIVP